MRPRGERGAGTVLWLGVVAVILTVGMLVATLGAALLAAARARHAADAAALAGAQSLLDGNGAVAACSRAGALASANGARLVSCRPGADDLQVEVAVAPGLPLGPREAHAVARAGDPGPQDFPHRDPNVAHP